MDFVIHRTQAPVDRFLAGYGEQVHPGCTELANESAHFEESSGEHDLHAFQALRDMDEILVHNFMVFTEVVEQGQYDLVVGDEAWDVDHFLHEHPELKRTAFAWVTDFVGFVPFPDGGEREELLTADYNAEMVEHLARAPRRARPLAVRRRPRGRRAARSRPRPAVDPRVDRRDVRLLRLRHGVRPGRPTLTAPACAPSWATATTSRSAWSRSAAPAWGWTCCGASWPRTRRRGRRSRGCAWSSSPARGSTRALTEALPADVARDWGRARGAPVRARPVAAPGGVRPRRRAGRPHHDDGARPRTGGRSSTSRCATTSSSSSTYGTGSTGTAPGGMVDYDATGAEELAAAMAAEIGRTVDYVPVPADGADRVAARLADLV